MHRQVGERLGQVGEEGLGPRSSQVLAEIDGFPARGQCPGPVAVLAPEDGEVVERPGQPGEEGLRAGPGQVTVKLDGLLDRRQRSDVVAVGALVDRQVAEREGYLLAELIGPGPSQVAEPPERLPRRRQRPGPLPVLALPVGQVGERHGQPEAEGLGLLPDQVPVELDGLHRQREASLALAGGTGPGRGLVEDGRQRVDRCGRVVPGRGQPSLREVPVQAAEEDGVGRHPLLEALRHRRPGVGRDALQRGERRSSLRAGDVECDLQQGRVDPTGRVHHVGGGHRVEAARPVQDLQERRPLAAGDQPEQPAEEGVTGGPVVEHVEHEVIGHRVGPQRQVALGIGQAFPQGAGHPVQRGSVPAESGDGGEQLLGPDAGGPGHGQAHGGAVEYVALRVLGVVAPEHPAPIGSFVEENRPVELPAVLGQGTGTLGGSPRQEHVVECRPTFGGIGCDGRRPTTAEGPVGGPRHRGRVRVAGGEGHVGRDPVRQVVVEQPLGQGLPPAGQRPGRDDDHGGQVDAAPERLEQGAHLRLAGLGVVDDDHQGGLDGAQPLDVRILGKGPQHAPVPAVGQQALHQLGGQAGLARPADSVDQDDLHRRPVERSPAAVVEDGELVASLEGHDLVVGPQEPERAERVVRVEVGAAQGRIGRLALDLQGVPLPPAVLDLDPDQPRPAVAGQVTGAGGQRLLEAGAEPAHGRPVVGPGEADHVNHHEVPWRSADLGLQLAHQGRRRRGEDHPFQRVIGPAGQPNGDHRVQGAGRGRPDQHDDRP